ncbi:MAG: hypothetical protein K2N03_01855 [Muribaculaceae bacterium]|nr:hypothetical protein [Muribaculaceae bacterium]
MRQPGEFIAYLKAVIALCGKGCRESFVLVTLVVGFLSFVGCRQHPVNREEVEEDVLVSIGDSSLTLRQVLLRIPGGLAEEDSVAMFASIVDNWIDEMLLSEVANDNINNLDDIEEKTRQYRRRLIVAAYRRQLRENGQINVSEDSIRSYYTHHRESLKLERPVVKGILIKIPADASRLKDVEQWAFSGRQEDIDKLDKYGLKETLQYSFFENRWVDWQNIAEQIPYRFGDADTFLTTHKNFETTYKGITYLLHISAYKESGSEMPEEYAKLAIAERLESESLADYEQKLLSSMKKRALKEGRLKSVGYDPISHKRL